MCFLEKKWTCKKNYIECDDTQKSKKKEAKNVDVFKTTKSKIQRETRMRIKQTHTIF